MKMSDFVHCKGCFDDFSIFYLFILIITFLIFIEMCRKLLLNMSKIKTGIKMRVNSEQSKKIQEICFENGIYWAKGKHLNPLAIPFLYINKYNELEYFDKTRELCFLEDDREEVSAELFIRTNGTCFELE